MASAFFVAGLGYGDEGKGSIVNFLCQEYGSKLVVRYNGGAQAAHNVVANDGRHHTFAQFGSGTFTGARTLLSRFMLVNPITLLNEGNGLKKVGISDPFRMVSVERDALVTTPFHVSANRIREMARTGRHGSCGMGIGETMQDFVEGKESLFVRDLTGDHTKLRKKLYRIQERKYAEVSPLTGEKGHSEWATLSGEPYYIDRAMDLYAAFADQVQIVGPEFLERYLKTKDDHVVFEGAQGALLDQDFGFQPHTTWTDMTFTNAEKLVDKAVVAIKLGVLRAYQTRHGAGPFISEDARFKGCSAEDHNTLNDWQGTFRSGAFDLVMARYAMNVMGSLAGLCINHTDRLDTFATETSGTVPTCVAYNMGGVDVDSIAVHRPFDLRYQEQLTEKLNAAKPVYQDISLMGYPWTLAKMLKCPLAIVGSGQKEKRFVDSWGDPLVY
jgi:adenylosuccinate synthase